MRGSIRCLFAAGFIAGYACESNVGLGGHEDADADADAAMDSGWDGTTDPPYDNPDALDTTGMDSWDTLPETSGDPEFPEGMFGDIPPDYAQMYYAGHECYRDDHCLGVSYSNPVCLFDLDGHVMYRGYCSALCTETSSCHGEHTDCLTGFGDTGDEGYCMALCATDHDCRTPEYYCLEDPMGQGILERFCVPMSWSG